MLADLIAEAQHDPELRGAWRDRVLEPLRSQHRIMLDRAMARGEIPASGDREVILDLFFGAAEHRLLLGHLPMTDEFIREVVDVILGGIRVAQALASLRVGACAAVRRASGSAGHDHVQSGALFGTHCPRSWAGARRGG